MFWKHIASWSEGKWEWEGKERKGEGRGEQGKFEGGEGRVKMELLQLQLVLYVVVFRKNWNGQRKITHPACISSFVKLPAPSPNSWRYIQSWK